MLDACNLQRPKLAKNGQKTVIFFPGNNLQDHTCLAGMVRYGGSTLLKKFVACRLGSRRCNTSGSAPSRFGPAIRPYRATMLGSHSLMTSGSSDNNNCSPQHSPKHRIRQSDSKTQIKIILGMARKSKRKEISLKCDYRSS